ncbi:hypothetical protein QCA50_011788 [Cerrena zonata]|uniref:Transmembrane protein n=1 Tax=Cerrena zonata TaxID=2478898 RepID=A0AAW0FTJ2_9APHY
MFTWQEDREVSEQKLLNKIAHFTAGLYFWELLTTLYFDWSFVSGKRRWRWPILLYFLNRYAYLAAMIVLLYTQDVSFDTELDCHVLLNFIQIGGNMAVAFASLNLAVRTIVLWSGNKYVITGLAIMVIGQWAVILQGGELQAEWMKGAGCVNLQTNNTLLAVTYAISTVLDTVVLLLSFWKLRILAKAVHTSVFVTILFRDGLIYFIVALLGNIVVVVFEVIDIDPLWNVIFNIPSVAIITIAATRAVRNLQEQITAFPKETVQPSNVFSTRFRSIESPLSIYSYQSFVRSRYDLESSQLELQRDSIPIPFNIEAGAMRTVAEKGIIGSRRYP